MGTYLDVSTLATYVHSEISSDQIPMDIALSAAEAAINIRCGRKFIVATTATDRRRQLSTSRIQRIYDCTTITTVKVGTTTIDPADFLPTPLDNLDDAGQTVPFEQLERPYCPWRTGCSTDLLTVTATWGWTVIPQPIVEACLILAAANWHTRDSATATIILNSGASVDGVSPASMVNPYRRVEAFGIA